MVITGYFECPDEIRELIAGIVIMKILCVVGEFERAWHSLVPEDGYVPTGWATGASADEVSTGSQVLR